MTEYSEEPHAWSAALLCVFIAAITLTACSANQTVAVESATDSSTTAIDHSTMDHSTMDHSTMHHAAPPSSTAIDPAATLSPDAFDAPAATAVEEAQKAAGDAHAGHAMPPAKKDQR